MSSFDYKIFVSFDIFRRIHNSWREGAEQPKIRQITVLRFLSISKYETISNFKGSKTPRPKICLLPCQTLLIDIIIPWYSKSK